MRSLLAFALALGVLLVPKLAEAAQATFAIVIGANQSVDSELQPLKYADDDAARYFDLFRLLGARTYLLTRLDDNTRRLHPQAAAEAEEPKREKLDRALAQLVTDVTQASSRDVDTVVYFVYAGHGNVKNGQGYLTLEDSRVTGAELAQIVARIPAKRIHVIADACASYFLAQSRGPGGERRALEGLRATSLSEDPRVGLLLSTSSARESHEWDAYQGGVFSHEVRSGLYGAADADRDGEVTYREIAAFVARANAGVPNEKYRPDVYARAPRAGATLLDIKPALGRRLVIEGTHAGRYWVEDARGVRLADFHNAQGHEIRLVRPAPTGTVYLRRASDDREFALEPAPEVLALNDLSANEPRSQARGAAHEAFSMLFSVPFDDKAVAEYCDEERAAPAVERPAVRASSGPPKALGFTFLGLAAAGATLGTIFYSQATRLESAAMASDSHRDAVARNANIDEYNVLTVVSFVSAGALAAAGAVVLLWPRAPRGVSAAALPGGGFIGYGASF